MARSQQASALRLALLKLKPTYL